jgi:four helix bundle protein
MAERNYDLEDRLLEYSVPVIRVCESMSRSFASAYVADQLLRSGCSPYGHHGEAESAESRNDFIHKLKVCHKELRESRRWLRLLRRVSLVKKPALLDGLITESEELVRIFPASIRTAKSNRPNPKRRRSDPDANN